MSEKIWNHQIFKDLRGIPGSRTPTGGILWGIQTGKSEIDGLEQHRRADVVRPRRMISLERLILRYT